MYFGNISDSELSQFHNQVLNNFSMPLVDVLASSLFKIETIISDSIYKIYPLFYCEEISSSNAEDRIIENKCIICEKNTDTRLYFNTSKNYSPSSLNCSSIINEAGMVSGIVYDEKGNALVGAEVTMKYNYYGHSSPVYTEKRISDIEGLFYFGINRHFNLHQVLITYDNLELVVYEL